MKLYIYGDPSYLYLTYQALVRIATDATEVHCCLLARSPLIESLPNICTIQLFRQQFSAEEISSSKTRNTTFLHKAMLVQSSATTGVCMDVNSVFPSITFDPSKLYTPSYWGEMGTEQYESTPIVSSTFNRLFADYLFHDKVHFSKEIHDSNIQTTDISKLMLIPSVIHVNNPKRSVLTGRDRLYQTIHQ